MDRHTPFFAKAVLAAASAVAISAGSHRALADVAGRASGMSQDHLPMTLNDGFEDPSTLRFDWPALMVGTGQYEDGPTGVTVLRFAKRSLVAVDVRGGGPGTINTDFVRLGYDVPELDAVVLSGGTFYGLETATAVSTALKDDGERDGNWNNIPVVMGSIIYDMGGRRLNEIYPDKRLAQAALRAAQPGIFPIGSYGGGRSAVFGGLFGCNTHSGQGAAFRQIGDVKIAVFTVVNALGVVTDRDGNVVSCYTGQNWPSPLKASDLMRAVPESIGGKWDGEASGPEKRNTTISVVVTNRKLTPAELNRLAVQVHTSMARAIQPFATEMDGDVLYAVSTGEVESGPTDSYLTATLGVVASELMWDAILAAVPPQPQHPQVNANAQVSSGNLDTYEGTYAFSSVAALRLNTEGGRLYAEASGERDVFAIRRNGKTELLPVDENTFVVPGRYPLTVRFDEGMVVINPGRWEQKGRRQP